MDLSEAGMDGEVVTWAPGASPGPFLPDTVPGGKVTAILHPPAPTAHRDRLSLADQEHVLGEGQDRDLCDL